MAESFDEDEDLDNPREEGFSAAEITHFYGKPMKSNPYHEGSLTFEDWDRGVIDFLMTLIPLLGENR
jgi:hypothetical protein